jgi:hypothetical protein
MRFKVLMAEGVFVDGNLLQDGIYERQVPVLYPVDITKELLVKRAKAFFEFLPTILFKKEYLINLNKCELVEVEVTIL